MNERTARSKWTPRKWTRAIPPWPLFIFLLIFTSLPPLFKLGGQPEGNTGAQRQLEQRALNAPGTAAAEDADCATKETE
jgi:hypothetical protein